MHMALAENFGRAFFLIVYMSDTPWTVTFCEFGHAKSIGCENRAGASYIHSLPALDLYSCLHFLYVTIDKVISGRYNAKAYRYIFFSPR